MEIRPLWFGIGTILEEAGYMALVLVVEDHESFSDALSYRLRKDGFEVAVCPTGPEALETFDRGEGEVKIWASACVGLEV
jgi:DNA-binding NtrC family response regulator